MKTIDDFKKECFEGLIEELKAMPDADYPVQISIDCIIQTKEEIFKKANIFAINRKSTAAAREMYRSYSVPALREIVLPGKLTIGNVIFEKNTILPFYGNHLIESPKEIKLDQFITGTIIVLMEVVPAMEEGIERDEFEKDMIKLLKAYGDRAMDILKKGESFKPILKKMVS